MLTSTASALPDATPRTVTSAESSASETSGTTWNSSMLLVETSNRIPLYGPQVLTTGP